MEADNGAIHLWEVAIFLPACNAYLHYLNGVNDSLKNSNYISAMANLRGLIESLGAIVYDGTAKLPKEAYEKFIKTGRLPKWDEKNKKWGVLGSRESVNYAQLVVDPKIKLKRIYDDCCDLLHFSATHMSFLGGFNPQVDEGKRIVQFKIGATDDIPIKTRREMIDLCADLTTQMGRIVNAAIQEKSQRKTPHEI